MHCFIRYYCWFRLKLLYQPASCRNGGSIFECRCLNLITVQNLKARSYRNLPLHRAPVIESFRLELCDSHIKPENINMWVVVALSRCLRELEISYKPYYPAKPDILPSNLYTCESLVILKLEGDILLDVPRMVSLPSLKTLMLQSVRYLNDENLQRLLSNCPILEDLVVKLRDYGDTMQKLTVVVPSLQSLSLFIRSNHDIERYWIETPLKYIELCDYNGNYHYGLIENMPDLIEAYVDCCFSDIYSLIGSMTSVKRITICSQAILDGLVFNELEHLEVCLCTLFSSEQLVRLLNASSKLKRLDISLMDCHDPPRQYMDYWNEPSTVPECLLSSLQSLNWSIYTGEPQEKAIVCYILEHAVSLETATIISYESNVPKFEMITLSSRASAACQLMFE